MRPDLLRWQRDGYPQFHRDKTTARWIAAAGSLAGMVIAFAVQGIGHKREAAPRSGWSGCPRDGPGDAFTRIFAEQLVTFPRFFLSGAWSAALRGTNEPR